jgi:type I restriction enzyme S subunit
VQDSYLDLSEIKYINVPQKQLPQFKLESGDVLLCEGNSAELVGRPALWQDEIEDCVHQNHILRVRCHRDILLPEYLLAYMQTSPSRGHFRRRAKNTTNLSTINSTDVRELPVPIPPLPEQGKIADLWQNARQTAGSLLASAADEERRALAETEVHIAGG